MSPEVRTPSVLIVDDNEEFADNLREVLEDAGYRVSVEGSYAGALRAAEHGFDVALVDLRLPDGDGTQLAASLKERAPESEVVLLTGFATVESAAAAVRAGACAYLVKPCSMNELLWTMEQAMRHVRQLEEKRALSRRAQIAEKLAAVGTLTAGLSHEIRNPLNAASLQLQVLERRIRKLPQEQQPALVDPLVLVRDEIQRLEHILEDFLQFARPREFVPTPVDMGSLVTRLADLLGTDAERRGITFERSIDERLPPVAGDAGRLQQVLMNLMLNALEAADTGGHARVTLRREPDDLVVSIDDSGPGIPIEARERIFEPFFTTKASGSGLGLPIVHSIITQHGGQISVSSSPLGGAAFVVRLPIMRA